MGWGAFIVVWVAPGPDEGNWIPAVASLVTIASTLGVGSLVAMFWRRRRRRRWGRVPRDDEHSISDVSESLRRGRTVGLTMVAISLVLLTCSLFVAEQVTTDYERLAEIADRVEGEVLEVSPIGSRDSTLRVAFTYEGQTRATKLNEFDPRDFEVGGPATVLVNPDDPSGTTVEGVERSSSTQQVIEVVGIFATLLLLPYGLVACRRVSLVGDAVLATGWRPATVSTEMVRRTTRVKVNGDLLLTLVNLPFSFRDPEGQVWITGPEQGPLAIRDEQGVVGIGRRSPFLSD